MTQRYPKGILKVSLHQNTHLRKAETPHTFKPRQCSKGTLETRLSPHLTIGGSFTDFICTLRCLTPLAQDSESQMGSRFDLSLETGALNARLGVEVTLSGPLVLLIDSCVHSRIHSLRACSDHHANSSDHIRFPFCCVHLRTQRMDISRSYIGDRKPR